MIQHKRRRTMKLTRKKKIIILLTYLFLAMIIGGLFIWYFTFPKQKIEYSLYLIGYSEDYTLENTFQKNTLSINLSFIEELFSSVIIVFYINCSFDYIEINDIGKCLSVPLTIITSYPSLIIKVVNIW